MINKLVVENLKHRPVRTLLSIVAISVQVAMVLTLVGVSKGMLDEQARRARGVGADIVISSPSSSVVSFSMDKPAGIVSFVAKQPHVVAATGVLVQGTDIFSYVTGVDLAQFDKLNGGFRFVAGGPFQGLDDVLVDSYYANQHNYRVGDSVTVLQHQWRLAGIYEPGMLARLVVPLDRLQDLAGKRNKVSVIYVKLDDPSRTSEVIADLLKKKMEDYKVRSMQEYTELYSVNSIPMLQEFIYVVIALGVLVGFLVVFLSMYTAVLERTREIGVLKALGASPGYVLNILLRETVLLAIAGSMLGILLSYATRFTINDVIHRSLIQAIVYDWWPRTAAIALVGAMLGAIYPGLKAARQDAIEALSYE